MTDVPTYERMTSLDSGFLEVERPECPMHIGTIAVIDGGPLVDADGELRIDDLRCHIEARLDRLPRFRRKVMFVPFGSGRPVWVDDDAFDIRNHVLHVHFPQPISREQLLAHGEELQMVQLDRTRPLWELWFVTGLEDGNVGLIEKVHHALVDGVSGVDVAAALFDVEPRTEPDRMTTPWEPEPAPTSTQLLSDSVRARLGEPLALARLAEQAVRSPWTSLEHASRVAGALGSMLSLQPLAPRTSLMQPVGRHRRLHPVVLDMELVQDIRHALACTVNDVVIAAVAGGMREVMLSRGDRTDGVELHAFVPVSTRPDDQHGTLGNRVAGMLAALPVGQPTAIERLVAAREVLLDHKRHHQEAAFEWLLDAVAWAPDVVRSVAHFAIVHQPFVNLVVTNIPGPPFPLYLMGGRLLETVPVVPLIGRLAVGIAVLSYDRTLTIGIHVDRDAVPDVELIAKGIEASIAELAALVPSRRSYDGAMPDATETRDTAPRTPGAPLRPPRTVTRRVTKPIRLPDGSRARRATVARRGLGSAARATQRSASSTWDPPAQPRRKDPKGASKKSTATRRPTARRSG